MKESVRSGGLQLAVEVEQAKGEGKHPAVILLHGNTGWKDEEHITTLSRELVDAGITAIRFDAPGSGESEGSWEHDYRATNYIRSVKDVYDWAVSNLSIDTSKVGLWGHSMGGMVAIQAAARWPACISALCGSQPSTGRSPSSDGWEKQGGLEKKTQIFGTIWLPAAFFKDRLQYDSVKTVASLKMPQLYIAGTKDKYVPLAEAQDIFDHAGGSKQLEVFETDHFYKNDPEMLQRINDVTVSFFREHLL